VNRKPSLFPAAKMARGIIYVSNTRVLLLTVLALNLLTHIKIKPKSYGPVVKLFIKKNKTSQS
jgi:hypothetical protein